jgi:release factor glutamine methyltransferase
MRCAWHDRPSVPQADVLTGGTLGSLLDAGAARLRATGVRDARRQAVALWAAVTGASPGALWLARDRPPAVGLERLWCAAVDRLASGEPLAYVAGSAGFRTLELAVDPRVLIPRPETEGLVDLVLAWGRASFGAGCWGTVVDVGTGSGCVALSLAVEGAFGRVLGVDASPGALDVAAGNIERVRPPVPVDLLCGDLLEPLAEGRVTAIVANPPYVAEEEAAALPAGVREYEPYEALFSPEAGSWHTRRLLAAARTRLMAGGLVALEIDSRRAGRAVEIAAACGWRNAEVRRDLFGRDRYLLATKE